MCGIVALFDLQQPGESLRKKVLEMSKRIRPSWARLVWYIRRQ